MFLMRSLFFFLLFGCSSDLPVLSVDKGCHTVTLQGGNMKKSDGLFPATYEQTRYGMRILSEEPLFSEDVYVVLKPACDNCDEERPTTLTVVSEYEIFIQSELLDLCFSYCIEEQYHKLYICL